MNFGCTTCRDNNHNWICTLPVGHTGRHMDRSAIDGFVYLSWPQLLPPPDPSTWFADALDYPRGDQ